MYGSMNGHMYDFSVSYDTIDTSNITDIHKYLMTKHNMLYMFEFIKQASYNQHV